MKMKAEKSWDELLYRGDVLVDVGFNRGGNPEARTNSTVMNCADLGATIVVALHGEIKEESEDGAIYVRPEAWARLLREMRDFLARSMILGRMVVSTEGFLLSMDEENKTSVAEAKRRLGAGFFDLTLNKAITALEERYEEEKKVSGRKVKGGLLRMIEMLAEEGE